MRALVVYESMFGNTQQISTAIAAGLSTRMPVQAVEVGAAPTEIPADVVLLVVGGPTHAHGMTKPESRKSAVDKATGALVSPGIGIREWLASARGGSSRVAAAAFDTRIKGPGLLWGSAAKAAEKGLRGLGLRLVVPAESFLVEGPTGPLYDRLVDGEVERARRWGESLASKVPAGVG